jgi:hypothetical protein
LNFFNNFFWFILGLIDEYYEVDEEEKEEDGEKVEKNWVLVVHRFIQ